jgi:transcription initiation factor TFIIE subunit alpha
MSSTSAEAEKVHTLLRHVLRAFYSTRQIIAYDILLKHATLRDIHLATLMNLTPKEVHKFLAPLILDNILQQHAKTDPKPDQEKRTDERKPRQRLFYFIDYRTAVDAVKWRMVQLSSLLNKDSQTHEPQYVCPRCSRRYSTFDAVSLLSPDLTTFQCLDCGSPLQEETNVFNANGEDKAKDTRLMQQVDPIVRAMKAVDKIHVPENTFVIALANAIAPFDDAETSLDYPNLAPQTTKNQTDTATINQTLKIDFSGIETKEEDIAKRNAQQQQNALPVWYTQSTISGELTHAGSRQSDNQELISSFRIGQDDDKDKKKEGMDSGMEDQIAAYYAAVRKNAQEDAAQFAAEDADFEDDEGNWEDSNIGVGTGLSSTISTPAAATPAGPSTNSGTKEEEDDDEDEDEEFEDV